MSHLSKVFNKVPVKVQDRSGFDMSHENLFSAKIGTLIPASVEEVMPGDVVSVGGALSVELPPLATNFKGRVDARLEAFFIPNRLLWAGWQDYICQDANHKPVVPGFTVSTEVPRVRLSVANGGPGSLADYLGVKSLIPTAGESTTTADFNALPFLAYQKVIDDWYRDSNVQQPFFVDGLEQLEGGTYGSNFGAAKMPYLRGTGVLSADTSWINVNSMRGYNGRYVYSLAQRNFAKDYFTTMTTAPQAGAESQLQFDVVSDVTTQEGNEITGSGKFSIASLRAANALQKWLERNNVAGTRYYDQILAHYGVLPSDAAFQRAILLGSMTTPVIVNSIAQNSQFTTNAQTKNPYANSTGAMFGKGNAFGKDSLINNFEVKEHGFIMIMFSLVPHAYYSTGSRRYITSRSTSDTYAFPEFAGIGDQEIYKSEMVSSIGALANPSVIGYAQRYAEYKYHDDEIHGLLQDGQSLNSFVLSRGFNDSVVLSSSMLEIPTTFMDNVMVTTAGVSGFNAIVDCYFDSKYLRVLPEYSLPTLCESEGEGHKVYVPKGGTRL